MSTTAEVRINGIAVREVQDHFNPGMAEQATADEGDTVIMEVAAADAVALPTGGPFAKLTKLLHTLCSQLFSTLTANSVSMEDMESDYCFYGSCGCC